MRARNIKPGFFKNEILGQEDPFLSLLFEGLWCLADRMGRLEDRPGRIKAEVFPYRGSLDVHRYLTELSRLGFIRRYTVDGKNLIQVVNFLKHQRPHHTEKRSSLPPPVEVENQQTRDVTVSSPLKNGEYPPDSLIPDSLIPEVPPLPPTPSAEGGKKAKKATKAVKVPEWQVALPKDVLEALAGLREFWPDPEAGDLQPADRTTRRRDPVPKTRWPEVGARLAEIKSEGGDPAVCLAIGRRFVAEYRVEANRVWMKAAQFFFGKSADAPWRALYRAHVTNEALDLEAVEA